MNTALVRSGTDLVLAGPVGSLEAYVDRVSRVSVLTREEELELARRLQVGGDLDARGRQICHRAALRALTGFRRHYSLGHRHLVGTGHETRLVTRR